MLWRASQTLNYAVVTDIYDTIRYSSMYLTWSPSVLWHCWLGHVTREIVSEMTYNVSSATLNSAIPYQRGVKSWRVASLVYHTE